MENLKILVPPTNAKERVGKNIEDKEADKEIAGNRLVWKHIQNENRKMFLDPLGYDPIIDIDEIHHRNRRKTDDPYLKATTAKMKHHFPKIDNKERR